MELKVINDKGETQASVAASETLFGRDYNEALVHQVVVAYQANGRQGTREQKTRAEVRHSTKKPWRQKGTGRARAGMTSSPLWRGGGRIFPNKPDENFTQKVNRKMYRAGMASILSQLVREERLAVVEAFTLDAAEDEVARAEAEGHGDGRRADHHRHASTRTSTCPRATFPTCMVLEARNADPVSLIRCDQGPDHARARSSTSRRRCA